MRAILPKTIVLSGLLAIAFVASESHGVESNGFILELSTGIHSDVFARNDFTASEAEQYLAAAAALIAGEHDRDGSSCNDFTACINLVSSGVTPIALGEEDQVFTDAQEAGEFLVNARAIWPDIEIKVPEFSSHDRFRIPLIP